MFLLVAAGFLIAACTGYQESTSQDYRLYHRTGQSSMLPDWRPPYDGAIP